MKVRWPSSSEDYTRLAEALADLVGGRADVAARWFSFKDGERLVKGWAPWKGRRVSKDYRPLPGELVASFKNYKTGELEWRVMQPLSIANIIEHLRGRERLGVYVLDGEARCKFLAADFDDHRGALSPEQVWSDVRRFVDTCETHGWTVHIERSKSGLGYHVWLFFDAPVAAAKARAIGRWLFEEAQVLREDFATFDRFFPAQSELPPAGKGYGNLIGLPLCGAKDYAAGKTAWIDARGDLIPDALGHTLWMRDHGRNSAARVDEFMAEWQLEPDAAGAWSGAPRDPNAPLGTAEELDAVRTRCAFFRWMEHRANWPNVTEPLWFAWVSNACRFDPGDDYLHKTSQGHTSYDPLSTQSKIEHARSSSGPIGCAKIREWGFPGCPEGGCKLPGGRATAAPAGLGVWGAPRQVPPPKRRDRTVRIEDPHTPTPPKEAAPPTAASGSSAPKSAQASAAEVPWSEDVPCHPDTGMPWPPPVGGFQVSIGGVQDHTNQYIALRPLWVDALTRNYLGQFGLSIRFFDFDWKLKTHAIPRERLHEQGGVLGRELAAFGLPIVPGKEKWVSRYLVLQEGATRRRIRAAGRLGWFDAPESPAVFVLPNQVLGKSPEEIVYQPDVPMAAVETLHGQGRLKDWQEHVARPCMGNPVLMFAVMVGLAGPLLKLCQEQSGGFHLYGTTTAGKTTAAQVAASVWGCAADPQEGPEVTSLRKWYTTSNALESLAEAHNDMLLTLDEISEVDPHELGRIIYQLAGGLSKGRANAAGGLRMTRAWRLLFFSTGEKSVRQMLAQVGQVQKGGQRVRLPDIPADQKDAGAIIQNSGDQEPKDFAQDLKAACARYYGLAGPVFVAWLIAEAERVGMAELGAQLREELRQIEEKLTEDIEDQLPPEGRRVMRRFALVALAGGRAYLAGVIPWGIADTIWAVREVRDRWLRDQGQEYSEVDRALAHLRGQLIRHGDRFRWIDGSGRNAGARELLGYRVREWFLLTEAGLSELCGEHDPRVVLHALRARGLLWHDKDRLTRKSPRIEEFGNTRPNLYWIAVKFLGEAADEETEEDKAVVPPARPVSGETGAGGFPF